MAAEINTPHEITQPRDGCPHDPGDHAVIVILKTIFNSTQGIEPAMLRPEEIRR